MNLKRHLNNLKVKGYTLIENVISKKDCEKFKGYLEKDYKSEAEYFINIFKNHNRQSPIILDVGAGTGKLFKYLNKHSERYIAVEPNKKFCNFMKNKFYKETNLEIKNWDENPISPNFVR